MTRCLIAVFAVAVGIAGVSAVSAGPVKGRGTYSAKAPAVDERSDPIRFDIEYEAGQRAMASVQGDHLPVVPVTIQVFDAQKKLVGEHRPDGDVAAVVWYPERRQKYTILVRNLGVQWNELTVTLR